MRRSGHPSRPRGMTCCFFASLKTLLIPTKATALRWNQRPRASLSLAGFQVTLIGRFWVTPEDDHEVGLHAAIGRQDYGAIPPSTRCLDSFGEIYLAIHRCPLLL